MIDRMIGTVNWFNDTKGIGFITLNDGGEDLFFRHSSIRTEGFRTLGDGESVEFQIESDSGGRTNAVDVTFPEDGPVQGKDILNDQLKHHSADISLYKQMGKLIMVREKPLQVTATSRHIMVDDWQPNPPAVLQRLEGSGFEHLYRLATRIDKEKPRRLRFLTKKFGRRWNDESYNDAFKICRITDY